MWSSCFEDNFTPFSWNTKNRFSSLVLPNLQQEKLICKDMHCQQYVPTENYTFGISWGRSNIPEKTELYLIVRVCNMASPYEHNNCHLH
jgi:hypothetical protein